MNLKRRFGRHQAIHLRQFSVDRTNLFTGRVEFHVAEDFDKPNSTYMSLRYGRTISNDAGIRGMATGSGSHPEPSCVGVERTYDNENSMAIYTYTFEGIAVDHAEKWIEFELEFVMNQEPIETHPSFDVLQQIYGPYDPLNRLWQPVIPSAAAAVGLAAGTRGTQQGPVTNPMYGVTSYLVPSLVYRISFTDEDVDQNFFDNVGSIVIPPKFGDAFPDLQSWITNTTKRNWLKIAPKIRQHGSCISITEEYMLSGPKGWDPNIYSVTALEAQTL